MQGAQKLQQFVDICGETGGRGRLAHGRASSPHALQSHQDPLTSSPHIKGLGINQLPIHT